MATNLPLGFFIQFLEQLLKFLANFPLLKYVKSQRSYGFLITKKLIFGFQVLDLKVHFSASLSVSGYTNFSGELSELDLTVLQNSSILSCSFNEQMKKHKSSRSLSTLLTWRVI